MNVAVVGAGPAGAAAALVLARRGARVTLFERDAWPRPKACGDGLTPTTVALLDSLGIALPPGPTLGGTLVSGPAERAFRGGWPRGVPDGTTMPRAEFDALLVRAAVAAGAAFEPATTVARCAGGGLRVRSGGAAPVAAGRFDAVLLGEGAAGGLGRDCGLPPHRLRLAAYRGYARPRAGLPPEYQVHYASGLAPGYAWIFPGRDGRANVGAVLTRPGDVRAALRRWLGTSAIARRELGPDAPLEDGRGGVIPVGRARRVAGAVFAIGDAAGTADPLSAEGVSQAIGGGLAAATCLADSGGDLEGAADAYERALRRYDRNAREALRMRALFARMADPLVAAAAARPSLARHVVAAGYFPKHDARWFAGTLAALAGYETA